MAFIDIQPLPQDVWKMGRVCSRKPPTPYCLDCWHSYLLAVTSLSQQALSACTPTRRRFHLQLSCNISFPPLSGNALDDVLTSSELATTTKRRCRHQVCLFRLRGVIGGREFLLLIFCLPYSILSVCPAVYFSIAKVGITAHRKTRLRISIKDFYRKLGQALNFRPATALKFF